MESVMSQAAKIKNLMTKHDIASSKQKFESDDSQGSDLSYESSVTDEEDGNLGRIEFFKEEMARFFINYPELVNKNILHNDDDQSEDQSETHNDKLNKNWESIADEIFNEAKDSSTSLEALAKRISLYRYKLDQEDIIDLLLKEKGSILKEIELEMAHKKSEKSLIGQNEKKVNDSAQNCREDNMYYSWRKRKQFEFKANANKNKPQRSQSPTKENTETHGEKTKIVQTFHRSLHKSNSDNQLNGKPAKAKAQIVLKDSQSGAVPKEGKKKTVILLSKNDREDTHLDQSHLTNQNGERLAANWRHLVNFQPQTEIGKQLSEDIKKKNSPNDQLGIKKTIIEFLVNYKELINNEVINKVTLSQKIQKLYTDDAKELLMFYPSKIGSYESNPAPSANNFKEDNVEDKFSELLKDIAEGPLIKYWRELQENKV